MVDLKRMIFFSRAICSLAGLIFAGTMLISCSSLSQKNLEIESEGSPIQVKSQLSGFGVIWGIDFLPDGSVLFTERSGSMHRFDPKTKKTSKLLGLPAITRMGQGGLMDVRVHPNFKTNRWIYFSYTATVGSGTTTRIARAQLLDDQSTKNQLTNIEELFTAEPARNSGHHFGSRIVFDKRGYIFFSVGDRGSRGLAQKLDVHMGKVLRLHEDGRVPTDNPFVKTNEALPEIWSYGHRNPQGLFYDQKTETLFAQEHGPQGGDEINIIKKGKNYGWPIITYGREYGSGRKIGEGVSRSDVEPPLKYFTPSIAPGGFIVYRGQAIKQWHGDLLSTSLKLQHLNRIPFSNGKTGAEDRLLKGLEERLRAIREAPDGTVWLSTDSGRLLQISR